MRHCGAYRYDPNLTGHAGRLAVVLFDSGEMEYVCERHLWLVIKLYGGSSRISPFLKRSTETLPLYD